MRFLGAKYAKNAFVARALPRIPLGELTALQGREGRRGKGRGREREGRRRKGNGKVKGKVFDNFI